MPTPIQWADETWNPVSGCTKVSAGCANCYAERQAKWLQGMKKPGYQDGFKVTLHPEKLEQPLKWRKPRTIFVCSMGDLFHPDVPWSFVAQVFKIMERCEQHMFLVLTKRPEEMCRRCDGTRLLPNVALGTSIENQVTADERIPHLLRCPAAWRMLSVEPLLEAVDLKRVPLENGISRHIHHVIVGGESGPGARPCNVDDIRSVVAQCKAAGVSCFVKQLGARSFIHRDIWYNVKSVRAHDGDIDAPPGTVRLLLKHPKGGEPSEWPPDLQVREQPPWARKDD